MKITVDLSGLAALERVVALAPQDQTGRGDLAPDSPDWTWIPVDATRTPADWWDGSDYLDKPRPDFIALPGLEAPTFALAPDYREIVNAAFAVVESDGGEIVAAVDALRKALDVVFSDESAETVSLCVLDIRPGDRVDLEGVFKDEMEAHAAEFEYGLVMSVARETVDCVRLDFDNFPSFGFNASDSLMVIKATPEEAAKYADEDPA